MRPIATDGVALRVSVLDCELCKTAEPMPFGDKPQETKY